MKTTCHIATYRNLGRSKKINDKGHSSKNKNNPGDLSIRRRAARLRAPRCAAWRGAERCGAKGQGLLGGNARRLALEGGKRIKNGQDQQPRAQRLLRDLRSTTAASSPSLPVRRSRLLPALRRGEPGGAAGQLSPTLAGPGGRSEPAPHSAPAPSFSPSSTSP